MPKIQVEAKLRVERTEEERVKRLFELVDLVSDMFTAAEVDMPDQEAVSHEDAGDELIKVKFKGVREIYVTETYSADESAAKYSEDAVTVPVKPSGFRVSVMVPDDDGTFSEKPVGRSTADKIGTIAWLVLQAEIEQRIEAAGIEFCNCPVFVSGFSGIFDSILRR